MGWAGETKELRAQNPARGRFPRAKRSKEMHQPPQTFSFAFMGRRFGLATNHHFYIPRQRPFPSKHFELHRVARNLEIRPFDGGPLQRIAHLGLQIEARTVPDTLE